MTIYFLEKFVPILLILLAPLGCWALVSFELPNEDTFRFILTLFLMALVLYFVPSPVHYGPITQGGMKPSYPENGMTHIFVVTLSLFLGDGYGWWSAEIVANLLETTIIPLNIIGFLICFILLFTGYVYGTPPDNGTNNKGVINDFYSGMWLHPRLFQIDLKLFINSRFSMTLWFLHCISSLVTLFRRPNVDWGVVGCAFSQLLYLSSFFSQESHYVHTIDIIEDRAGFYETWGCIVWVPAVYTLHTRVGLKNGSGLTFTSALIIFVIGAAAWLCNVWANEERRRFRKNPERKLFLSSCIGSYIDATYYTLDECGKKVQRVNKLLTSGWWGWVRHPQYIFDIIQSFTWGILAGGFTNPLAFFYPIYITILLSHRCIRDEIRCVKKYGEYYKDYCKIVPMRMIPYVW